MLLFVAVLVQVSLASAYAPLGGSADVVLVVLLAVALLRGSIFGAAAGFGAGLLLDTANLGMLGFTSLLLTLAGLLDRALRRDDGAATASTRPSPRSPSSPCSTRFGSLALPSSSASRSPAAPVLAGLPATRPAQPDPHLAGLPRSCGGCFPPTELSDRVHEVRLLG